MRRGHVLKCHCFPSDDRFGAGGCWTYVFWVYGGQAKKNVGEIRTINEFSDGFPFPTDQGKFPSQCMQSPVSVTPGIPLQTHARCRLCCAPGTRPFLTSLASDFELPLGRAHPCFWLPYNIRCSPVLDQSLNPLKGGSINEQLKKKILNDKNKERRETSNKEFLEWNACVVFHKFLLITQPSLKSTVLMNTLWGHFSLSEYNSVHKPASSWAGDENLQLSNTWVTLGSPFCLLWGNPPVYT